MATTSIYLNFKNETEAAFEFYKTVFGGEFEGPVGRFKDIPSTPDTPAPAAEIGDLIMHICLPILGGVKLMGTDAPEEMGFTLKQGNNVYISLHPDTRADPIAYSHSSLQVEWWSYHCRKCFFWGITTAPVKINLGCSGCLIV